MTKAKLVRSNECWFQRITPAVAKRFPQYRPFIGMFLVREYIDCLEQGAVVTEGMVLAVQMRNACLRSSSVHQHHECSTAEARAEAA